MNVLNFQSPYKQGERPYDIFKDRMAAVSSLADGIKQMISNKYINKQNSALADGISSAISEQQSNELINMIESPPPEEINPPQLEETVGAFVDKYVMGSMTQKEQQMGLNAPLNTSILPQVPQQGSQQVSQQNTLPNAPTTGETMLPKSNVQQLYNTIKEMPTNEISWDNIYKEMTAGKKPYFMGETESEKFVMGQMINQVKDPRNKLESDVNLTTLVNEALYPETAKRQGKYPYTEQEVKDYEMFKQTLEPPEEQIDFDKLNEFIEANNMKLSGVNVNPKTGNLSYSFGSKGTDKSWGEVIGQANEFISLNPGYEITSTNPNTGSVSISKIGAPSGATTPKAPTYNTATKIDEGFRKKVENMDDFVAEIKRLQSLNIDTKAYETTEYYAKLMKEKFEKQMSFVDYASSKIEAGIESDEEYNYRQKYKDAWANARRYEEEYFKVTSEKLLVPGWENK